MGKLIATGLITLIFIGLPAGGHEITTNSVQMSDAPKWLKRTRVEKITDRMHTLLEWRIRKVQVVWHKETVEFEKVHGLGGSVLALARKSSNSIHIGPRVTTENFDQVFGHELVHIISNQKYKGAIPKWLEEGLANHLSKKGKVDYKWLAAKPFPKDVTQLSHPFSGTDDDTRYHYLASQALAEMIFSKCSMQTLLQLSVERKMEDYLLTYCEIKDLSGSYKTWVQKKAG